MQWLKKRFIILFYLLNITFSLVIVKASRETIYTYKSSVQNIITTCSSTMDKKYNMM